MAECNNFVNICANTNDFIISLVSIEIPQMFRALKACESQLL